MVGGKIVSLFDLLARRLFSAGIGIVNKIPHVQGRILGVAKRFHRPLVSPAMRNALSAMILLLALILPGSAKDFEAAATQAGVVGADGKVEKQIKGAPWVACAVGDILTTGDRIRTQPDSSASLMFTDKTVMRLGAGTTITLIDLSETPDGTLVRKVNQESGRTWSDVTKNPAKPTTFEVHGPNAVAAVRGTSFEVDADAADTDVLVWEGEVDCLAPGATAPTRIYAGKGRTNRFKAARGGAGVGSSFDPDGDLDGFRQWNLENRSRQKAWLAKLPARVNLNGGELRKWAASHHIKLTTNQRQKVRRMLNDRMKPGGGPGGRPSNNRPRQPGGQRPPR